MIWHLLKSTGYLFCHLKELKKITPSVTSNKATFEITDAKLYVPIVMLSIKDNAKLSKLLGKGFKRSIY